MNKIEPLNYNVFQGTKYQRGYGFKNHFNFHHHKLKSLNLMENGRSYPFSGALDFNFDKGEYLSGFKTLETHSKSIYGNGISRNDYANGYTLYLFDITPKRRMWRN